MANPDVAATTSGTRVGISVLENDSDPDGDVLTLVGLPVKPANGTVARGTLKVFYTPAVGFCSKRDLNS